MVSAATRLQLRSAKKIAAKALEKGIARSFSTVAVSVYHGRVKALADGAPVRAVTSCNEKDKHIMAEKP